MRVPRDDGYEPYELAELLRRWRAGDTRVFPALRNRVVPLVARLAKEYCVENSHRGIARDCPGATCHLAYPHILDNLVDRALGHPAGWLGASQTRRGVAIEWLESGAAESIPLGAYVDAVIRRKGGAAEAKRAWRKAIGTPMRFRPTLDLSLEDLWLAVQTEFDRPDVPDAVRDAVVATGMETRIGLDRLVRALFEDASDMGREEPFLARRVARYVGGERVTPAFVRQVALAAEVVDALVELHAPRWYERYLAAPRRATWWPPNPLPGDVLGDGEGLAGAG